MTLPPLLQSQRASVARLTMETQAGAIYAAAHRLDGEFERVIAVLLERSGKVVVTGDKDCELMSLQLADRLRRAGLRPLLVNAADAVRAKMGQYEPGDPVLLLSATGTGRDMVPLVNWLREMGSSTIGILGNGASALAPEVDYALDASASLEEDTHCLDGAVRSAVAASIGDALAAALAQDPPTKAAESATASSTDRPAVRTVASVMHPCAEVARVASRDSIRAVAAEMTRHPLGGACVLAGDDYLEGLITERDLARAFHSAGSLRAADIMTQSPLAVTPDMPLASAVRLMEVGSAVASVLPVVDQRQRRCLGLVRLLDICQVGLA